MLDAGTTNTCIDQILLVCEDLIDGKSLYRRSRWRRIHSGDSKERCDKGSILHERLHGVFQDSGVDVWDCELLV